MLKTKSTYTLTEGQGKGSSFVVVVVSLLVRRKGHCRFFFFYNSVSTCLLSLISEEDQIGMGFTCPPFATFNEALKFFIKNLNIGRPISSYIVFTAL